MNRQTYEPADLWSVVLYAVSKVHDRRRMDGNTLGVVLEYTPQYSNGRRITPIRQPPWPHSGDSDRGSFY
jgi:hypothetical protein